MAREAHGRLRFSHVHGEEKEGRVFAQGEASEVGSGYREWASSVVLQELHRAGWRLAGLLKTIL